MKISAVSKREIIRSIRWRYDVWRYDFMERLERDEKYFNLRDELVKCLEMWESVLSPLGLKIHHDKYFSVIDIVEI